MSGTSEKLQKLSTDKLMDIVKNYRQYGYDENTRLLAIAALEERGISREQLELTGNFKNHTYDLAEDMYTSFNKNSKIAFVLYGIFIVSLVLFPVLRPRADDPTLTILAVSAFALYFFFLMRSFFNQSRFYKTAGQDYRAEGAAVYLFFGMPFYLFMFFHFKNQMKEKMSTIK